MAYLLDVIETTPALILVPRFVLSLRRLYARDPCRKCEGDIDTAFGFTSACSHDAVMSPITFADARRNERLELGEEIQMEEWEIPRDGDGA